MAANSSEVKRLCKRDSFARPVSNTDGPEWQSASITPSQAKDLTTRPVDWEDLHTDSSNAKFTETPKRPTDTTGLWMASATWFLRTSIGRPITASLRVEPNTRFFPEPKSTAAPKAEPSRKAHICSNRTRDIPTSRTGRFSQSPRSRSESARSTWRSTNPSRRNLYCTTSSEISSDCENEHHHHSMFETC